MSVWLLFNANQIQNHTQQESNNYSHLVKILTNTDISDDTASSDLLSYALMDRGP